MSHRATTEAVTGSVSARSSGFFISCAALVTATLAVALPTFWRFRVEGDIATHAATAPDIATSAGAISYSLWYPLLYVVSGFSRSLPQLQAVSVVLLTVAVLAKVLLVAWYAARRTGSQPWAVATGLVALLAMPLPNPAQLDRIYLGQITANLWHNSTWVLSVPFSMVAFFLGCRLLRDPTPRAAGLASLAIVVSTACKPNFSLAFLPVLGIALIVVVFRQHLGWARSAVLIITTFVPVTLLLILQFALTFGEEGVIDVSLGVDPLAIWKVFSINLPWSVVVSFAGPVALLVALPRASRRSPEVVIGVITLALATAQLAVLTERQPNGQLALSGNFFWGAYTAMAIVFVVLTVSVGAAIIRGKLLWRAPRCLLAGALLVGHCATGAFYVTHAGVDGFPITFRIGSSLVER